MYYSDLHIHSKYARATSKKLSFLELARWAIIKGLHLVGTGDILHPKWRQEFQDSLKYDKSTGFYVPTEELLNRLQNDNELNVLQIPNLTIPQFIPTVETSHIYKHKNKVRRVHLVTIFKSIEQVEKIAQILLENHVNLTSDGRPIFGMPVKEYLQLLLNALGPENFNLIPAHIWTPWYALLGSKSGYNSVTEAFEDLTPYITALETGLSSDPKMNRMIQDLNQFLLVSNSDAHSAPRLGREANIHKRLDNISDLFESITKGKTLYGTIEFYPEEGRYHYDGHRNCKISLSPEETAKYKGICPVCHKPLTIGVLNRVYTIANKSQNHAHSVSAKSTRNLNTSGKDLLKHYKSVYSIPLATIIAEAINSKPASKRVQTFYFQIIQEYGPELKILHEYPISQIKEESIACGIDLMRRRKIILKPGYDGEYGIVKINMNHCTDKETGQLSLI